MEVSEDLWDQDILVSKGDLSEAKTEIKAAITLLKMDGRSQPGALPPHLRKTLSFSPGAVSSV